MDSVRDTQRHRRHQDKNIVCTAYVDARNPLLGQRYMARIDNYSRRSVLAFLPQKVELQMVQYYYPLRAYDGDRLLFVCSDSDSFFGKPTDGPKLSRKRFRSAFVPQSRTIRRQSAILRTVVQLTDRVQRRRHRTLYGRNRIRQHQLYPQGKRERFGKRQIYKRRQVAEGSGIYVGRQDAIPAYVFAATTPCRSL